MVGPRRGMPKPKAIPARKILRAIPLAVSPDGKSDLRLVELSPGSRFRWEARVRDPISNKWRIVRVSFGKGDERERITENAHGVFGGGKSNLRFL